MNTAQNTKFICTLWVTFFMLFVTCCCNFAIAQVKPLRFKHLTINEGLSQNTVFSVFQDHHGFIWFGTEDGLNRYDGYEFKIFKNELNNQKSLQNNQVNFITEDTNHQLIVGTSGGLSFFNRETEDFVNIVIPKEQKDLQSANFVTAIACIGHQLWVGTYDGLKLFDLRERKFKKNSFPKTFNSSIVQTLFIDRKQQLWVGFKSELRLLDLKRRAEVALPVQISLAFKKNPSTVRVIKQDRYGNMWIGTERSGVFYFDRAKNSCINLYHTAQTNSLPVNVVRDIYFHGDRQVWIATRKGLSIYDRFKHTFTNYLPDKYDAGSLSHRSILKILPDRLGNIWIGTYAGGVNSYHPSNLNFSVIGEQKGPMIGLSSPVVSSIVHDNDGGLWIGTEGGGLNYLHRALNHKQVYLLNKKVDGSENIVKSLAKDHRGNLWIGAFDGLNYFNTTTKSITSYQFSGDAEFQGRTQIYSLLMDGEKLWAGTNGGGLILIDPVHKTEKIYTADSKYKNSLVGDNITALLKDQHGNLWIGTLQGLCVFNIKKQEFKQFKHAPKKEFTLTSNYITTLFLDAEKRLWVGTRGGGLNLYDPVKDRFYNLTEKEGLANNVIRAINQDKTGVIWLSSNKGISAFNPAHLNLAERKLAVKNYSISDGLQSNQFLSNATDRLASGELLFGGINGISSFIPSQIVINKRESPVVFTDFLIKNKPLDFATDDSPIKKSINEERNITLPYDQAYFTIKFAMLNYQNNSKNKYAYKLEGFGKDDWHDVDDQRSATYTNLNAGKYIFMVRAANSDGIWNSKVDQLNIQILPPWYKTWWAYLIYLIVISCLLYLFYYFSFKTARLQNELHFEQLSHEKDQDLAQRKLTFFTYISHEIKTPLTLIISPIEKLLHTVIDHKVQQQLQLIYRNGERLMRLTNQLLDYRKFETGNMKLQTAEGNIVRFTKEVMAAFQSYATNKNIQFKLVSVQKSIRVWFDRDKMEKVMYNLISNALKFTPSGGKLIIRVTEVKFTSEPITDWVSIAVEDNGVGIPKENIHTIFDQFQHFNTNGINQEGTGLGLSFSKGLIEMHQGKIEVQSTVAHGNLPGSTIFTLLLPLGKTHLAASEIIQNYNNSEDIRTYLIQDPIQLNDTTSAKKTQILSANGGQRLIILIVEDNTELLHFIASNFVDDFEVVTSLDGIEGWEKATTIIPDIIISDVMMPKLTGTELCSRLKNDNRTSHIPLILLTARETLLYKIEGLETGADDYIVKPFNLKHLEVRIWNLLETRAKLREKYSRDLILQPTNLAVTSLDEKLLIKAMHYIEENLANENLSVEALSKEVGMSKATLYRKLKALTNQNTNEFIRTVRLNRAAQLLKQHKLNINEIAYLVGFNDQDYFRKCFKEQFGCTPRAYEAKEK